VTKGSGLKFYCVLGELYHGDVNRLRTMFLNVKSPSPQFLHFLERKIMVYCEGYQDPQYCDGCYEVVSVSEEFQAKLGNY